MDFEFAVDRVTVNGELKIRNRFKYYFLGKRTTTHHSWVNLTVI